MNRNILTSIILLSLCAACICGCDVSTPLNTEEDVLTVEPGTVDISGSPVITYNIPDTNDAAPDEPAQKDADAKEEVYTFINESGMTISERIAVPQGYERVKTSSDSFLSFMRSYPLLPYGEPVRYYNGQEKEDQEIACSVFDLKMVSGDLQQCADSCMRLYTEYLQAAGAYDKISFHFTDNSVCRYAKGQDTDEYLKKLFSYAGTLSMSRYDTVKTELHDMTAGDLFLKGGSPGHAMMIVDVAQDDNGNKAFLVAQGYMPAQSFHLVKNIRHLDDPWYYEEEISFPCYIGTYEFADSSVLRHPVCLDID